LFLFVKINLNNINKGVVKMAIEFDTIAAISTPPGEGGLGIVRLRGDEALEIAEKVYKLGDKRLSDQPSHTIHYGNIYHTKTNEKIDEVMVTIMRGPKTYTREDIIEINTNGGIIITKKIILIVLVDDAHYS